MMKRKKGAYVIEVEFEEEKVEKTMKMDVSGLNDDEEEADKSVFSRQA